MNGMAFKVSLESESDSENCALKQKLLRTSSTSVEIGEELLMPEYKLQSCYTFIIRQRGNFLDNQDDQKSEWSPRALNRQQTVQNQSFIERAEWKCFLNECLQIPAAALRQQECIELGKVSAKHCRGNLDVIKRFKYASKAATNNTVVEQGFNDAKKTAIETGRRKTDPGEMDEMNFHDLRSLPKNLKKQIRLRDSVSAPNELTRSDTLFEFQGWSSPSNEYRNISEKIHAHFMKEKGALLKTKIITATKKILSMESMKKVLKKSIYGDSLTRRQNRHRSDLFHSYTMNDLDPLAQIDPSKLPVDESPWFSMR